MIRKSFTKLKRIIFSGLVMSLCTFVFNPTTPANAAMVQESEPNDDWTTADNLSLNTWVKGTMRRKADDRYYRDKDYYKFTISQAGETSIEIKPDDTNTINSSWDVYLSDSNKHDLCKWSNVHTLKSSKVGWMPGTYYLRVNVWSGTDGDNAYNLIVHNTPSSQWEKDRYYDDKNLSNANILSLNKEYTGNLYDKQDVDYYRFKLNGTNAVSFKFKMDDTVSKSCVWRIDFQEFNSKNPLIPKYEYVSANQTINIPKCSGDLLVKIRSYSNAEEAIYHIEASRKPITPEISSIKANKRKVSLRWKKVSNATGYYVYRSTNPKTSFKKVKTVTGGQTSYTEKKALSKNKTYYYKIVAFDKSGSKITKSNASKAKKIFVK
ncbi:MAG: hypothetical protein ACLRIQ_12475 [Blautia wexlerae]|jgi:hypothetical protein